MINAYSDQRVAQDIERFSSYLANLYGNVFKPVTDLALFTSKARLRISSPRSPPRTSPTERYLCS